MVTAIASGGSTSPKTMEMLAEGAFVANALSRLRQGYGGPRDNASHLFCRLVFFAFHHFAALGDQKIARFLAE